MKHTKQWLALLLAVVMTAALFAVPASAVDKAPNDFGIRTYVALGDSIATGLNDHTGTNEDAYGSWANGYTVKLAEKLGLITDETPSYVPDYHCVYYTSPNDSGFRPWAFPAMRTKEILQQVDPTYEYERDRFADYWLDNGELNERLGDVPALIQADVKEADLITLNIGSNDVVLAQLRETAWAIEDEVGVGASAIIDLMKSKLGFADAPTLPEGTDENAIVMKFLPLFVKNVMKGYNEFLQNMPRILKALRAQNETAQIVVIGIFNPVHSLSLTEDKLPISIGEMLDGVMLPLNAALANFCMRYRCTYVDVVDEPVDGSMHPTNEGYLDIADRIYAKLKFQPAETDFTDTENLSPEFQNAINWAAGAGVTNGFPDGTFQPDKTCTRAEIVTFLWRMAGEPEAAAPAAFEDVAADAWYAEPVAWAAENGITNGTSETKFSPDQTCTRGQIVTFLYRYDRLVNAEAGETTAEKTFRDVSPAAYYGAPVTWAVKNGITKGISSVLFAPLQSCSRVQAVTFLFRYSQL
jgi:lysophospholipase L1-like esterase